MTDGRIGSVDVGDFDVVIVVVVVVVVCLLFDGRPRDGAGLKN